MLKSKITAARVLSVPFRGLIKIYDNTCKKSLRAKCSKVIFINIEICSACYIICCCWIGTSKGWKWIWDMPIKQDSGTFWGCIYVWLVMHQSIPAALSPNPPPLSRADPQVLAFFWPWMANSWGWGLLSCQIPCSGDEKRRQMPCPPSTLQHFSLIAQSNSAVLNFLMCDFLFQVMSSFVIALGF